MDFLWLSLMMAHFPGIVPYTKFSWQLRKRSKVLSESLSLKNKIILLPERRVWVWPMLLPCTGRCIHSREQKRHTKALVDRLCFVPRCHCPLESVKVFILDNKIKTKLKEFHTLPLVNDGSEVF